MNGWTKASLSELGDLSRGKSKHRPRNDASLYDGDYPFIQTGDVKEANFYVNEYSQTYNEKGLKQSKLWEKDTLCITIAANIAESALLKFPACFPDSIVGFVPHEGVSDVRFIKYLLDNYKAEFQKRSKGATQDNLSVSKINSLKVKVPNYKYQVRIADIISAHDNLIENNQKRIKILEEMAQRLYTEWFIKFKFPGHEKMKMVDSGTEFGMIPEEWEVRKFRDLTSYYIGGGWGKEELEEKYTEAGYVIRGTDIPDASIGNITSVPQRYHKPSNYKSRKLIKGDIVFEVSGGSKNQSIGRALLLNEVLLKRFKDRVMCASFCKLIRPRKDLHNYIYLSLKDMYTKEIMDLYQIKSTGISNFKFEEFLDHQKVILPSLQILGNFSMKIGGYYDEIQSLGSINSNLVKTKNLLIENLVSGKRILKS